MHSPEISTTQPGSVSVEGVPAQATQEQAAPVGFQRDFFLHECASLHDEINARMAQRGNLFTFTIITAGSLLSLGATTHPEIALFYPILSLFLAAAWSDENGKIGALSAYLHDQEVQYNLDGWETYHRKPRPSSRLFPASLQALFPRNLLSLSTRGVFLATQVLAILVGLIQLPDIVSKSGQALFLIVLFILAVVATVATIFVIQHRRDRTMEKEQH